MRTLWIALALIISGCASYEPDQYGNYNDVTLTPNEMHAISQDIASSFASPMARVPSLTSITMAVRLLKRSLKNCA